MKVPATKPGTWVWSPGPYKVGGQNWLTDRPLTPVHPQWHVCSHPPPHTISEYNFKIFQILERLGHGRVDSILNYHWNLNAHHSGPNRSEPKSPARSEKEFKEVGDFWRLFKLDQAIWGIWAKNVLAKEIPALGVFKWTDLQDLPYPLPRYLILWHYKITSQMTLIAH